MQISIFWFRRDLRLYDNKGFYHALMNNTGVLPIFIFDKNIIGKLPENEARIEFIYLNLKEINSRLGFLGKGIKVYSGTPTEVFSELMATYNIAAVYSNMDHEPYGIERDWEVKNLLSTANIPFNQYLDHLIFDKTETLKNDGTPYLVFTPFSKKCLAVLNENHFQYYPSESLLSKLCDIENNTLSDLQEYGFKPSGIKFTQPVADVSIISDYHNTRDFPYLNGTTRIGIHLRFGTVSIRALAKSTFSLNKKYFNELLWREFYAMILWQFPSVVTNEFKPQYSRILWLNNYEEFERWKSGTTGYPIVDAGMRELSQSGYMHNRVRMITASFLTKHLLIDWRWGEAWFAFKLLDFELSSNNGGWQWAAGCGCDAAPYFRIFNPEEQQKKFDPKMEYIKKWVPEVHSSAYPQPMVEHKFARERCLSAFKNAL